MSHSLSFADRSSFLGVSDDVSRPKDAVFPEVQLIQHALVVAARSPQVSSSPPLSRAISPVSPL